MELENHLKTGKRLCDNISLFQHGLMIGSCSPNTDYAASFLTWETLCVHEVVSEGSPVRLHIANRIGPVSRSALDGMQHSSAMSVQ